MTHNLLELYKGLENDFAALIGSVRFSADINLRLERIEHLLSLLGNPHQAYPSIHIGGTSGKGSTATVAATILTQAGYKTGLHLSPHLQLINERHQINNQIAPTTRLVKYFIDVKAAMEIVAKENPFGRPSYFEAQTALAFYYFQQEAVDVAVIEVGLGGTLDATNVVPASVAVLTNVGLDHTAILGDTIEKIITDKAGIIKPHQNVICGVKQPSARAIVAERCQIKEARLWQLDDNVTYQVHSHDNFTLNGPVHTYEHLELGMKGDFQLANAACAAAAVQVLPGFNISEKAVREGLRKACIPGRMEIVQNNPVVVLDGAHNPEKMKAARQIMAADYQDKSCTIVLALKSDKAAEDVLPYALRNAKTLILTEFVVKGLWTPLPPETLAELSKTIAPEVDIYIEPDPILAVEKALTLTGPNDLVWITGSLYLVGDVRDYWYPSAKLLEQAEAGLPGSLILS